MAEHPLKQSRSSAEFRVAVRCHSTNVAGTAADRATIVAGDLAAFRFSRAFDHTKDFVHLPSDFDSSASKNIWLLCDFS